MRLISHFGVFLKKKQDKHPNKKGNKQILTARREGGWALFYPMTSPQLLFFCGHGHGSPAQHHLPLIFRPHVLA